MITDLLFAPARMLANLGWWITAGATTWLVVGACVAIPLGMRLGDVSRAYPPADKR